MNECFPFKHIKTCDKKNTRLENRGSWQECAEQISFPLAKYAGYLNIFKGMRGLKYMPIYHFKALLMLAGGMSYRILFSRILLRD